MIKGARFCVALGGLALIAAATSLFAQADSATLKLKAGTVDVARGDVDSPHVVIKLARPLSHRERRLLIDAGVTLDAYIPDNAYLANITNADLNALSQMSFITGIGDWQPDWKLAPSLTDAERFTTDKRKALARDGKHRLIVHAHRGADDAALVEQLTTLGVNVLERSRGYHGSQLLVDVDTTQVKALKTISSIRYVETAPEATPRNSSTNWISQSNIPDMTPLWDQGLHGENQTVGLIDWDMDEFHCSFRASAPIGPLHRKIQAYFGLGQSALFGYHGTHTASVLTGNPLDETASPDLTGIAYESRLVFQDQAAIITETNLAERLLIAQSEGAFVHSNSWGSTFDTSYNAWAADIDAFSFENEDNLVIFAIINGNALSSLLSPENAKNCLAVGAAGDAGDQGNPGSGASGPTDDGRQKPEVWATGCQSRAANVGTNCDVIQRSCATSWAAPAVAGLATLTRQYFTDGFYPSGIADAADAFTPTGALLKAVLVNSAVDMTGIEGYYGSREGYGRVLLDDALYFDGDARGLIVRDVRHADGLETSNTAEYEFAVTSDTEPLKVTMCYHDAPALVGTDFAPVNNLDLVVISPSGTTYRGNDYAGFETQADGNADMLNNTEQVTRLAPEVGTWQVIVEGTAVNDGPQGFALAITGAVGEADAEPGFDLAVTIDPVDQVVEVGELGAIRVTVTNNGSIPSTGGVLRIDMSDGLETPNRRPGLGSCVSTPSSIECDLNGLAAGGSQTLQRSLRVLEEGVHPFTALFTPDEDDIDSDNNSATGIIRTPANFDLQVRGITGPATIPANTPTEYTAVVYNSGPGESTPTSVVIEVEPGLRMVSSTNCDIKSELSLDCTIPALPAGATHQLAFRIAADSTLASALQIRSSLAKPPIDNDDTNNELALIVTVQNDDATNQNKPDADGDGVPDESDVCAEGDDTLDADGDGTPDACDACPDDANKTDPQLCGCGNPETDSDADGIPDCGDGCPDDPNKLDAGDCGCGVADTDADENGVNDCLEGNAPTELTDDSPVPLEFRLEDLDPCFVRYLMQSFLGIPMCGPCISFACCGIYAGIASMRRRHRKHQRRAHLR